MPSSRRRLLGLMGAVPGALSWPWPGAFRTLRELRPRNGPATRELIELVSFGRGAA